MLNKPTIAVLVLIIVVVIGAGIYAVSTQTQTNSQSNDNTPDDTSQVNTSQNNSGENMISAEEAQEIAKEYIEEPGATAGTPQLVEEDGTKIYVVPVIMNSSTVGQIEIDAYTGENVGGAGGAP